MIVLDTNVLSELMRPQLTDSVLAWADQLTPQKVAITDMNAAEILHSIAWLPDSRRKQQLTKGWETLFTNLLQHPVLPFNSAELHWFGALVAHRERLARPISNADAVIATTTLAHDGHLATRNTSDFDTIGLSLINPWDLDEQPT